MVDLTDERYIGMLKVNGFDDACIGVATRCGQVDILAYSTEKVIHQLMKNGMDLDDAWEYFNFNIEGAWMGDATPCFISELGGEEEDPHVSS